MLFEFINDIVTPHFGMVDPTCYPVTTRVERQTETEEMMNGRVKKRRFAINAVSTELR